VSDDKLNGDNLRREIAALKTAVAVAESVLSQAQAHMRVEAQYMAQVQVQLATITEKIATQQRIIWALMAVLLAEGAAMTMYLVRTLISLP
jgi:hypothetical protein